MTTIKNKTLFTAETISASGASYSDIIDNIANEGYYAIQATITGNGTMAITYQNSNDGSTYAIPESVTTLLSGLTKTSGPGSDGKIIKQVDVQIARYTKFKFYETGGANSVTVTAELVYK